MKKVNKKQLDNAPKRKGDEKTNDSNYRINTTNADLAEFKCKKVIILLLLLTPRTWRVVLVFPHSILVSVIISYTNMAATRHVILDFLKAKVNFC